MELGNSTVPAAAVVKTPEPGSEIQPSKQLPFSNGVLKRHAPPHVHHANPASHHPIVVAYKECLKNHAASLGGHAVDGCGEFMPSPTSNPAVPTSLKCAACGCHRNFHRREPDELQLIPPVLPNAIPSMEYQPHHRHHPPPPVSDNRRSSTSPNNSPSPPPISSAYYPSAPHMLLSLSHGLSGPSSIGNTPVPLSFSTAPLASSPNGGRKRFRSKFTQYQKEQMLQFADRVDWRIQKKDEDLIAKFCGKIGVERCVLKVWMHNNKNTPAKKDNQTLTDNNGMPSTSLSAAAVDNDNRSGIGYGSVDAISDDGAHFHRHQHLHESSGDTKLHSSSDIGEDFSLYRLQKNTGIANPQAAMGTNG